jgi:Uma2 family endonuclease
MSSATAGSGLTWENFLDLPDDPKYRHAELVDGELILVNPPTWLHQHVVMRLVVALELWIRGGPGRGTVTMEPPVQIRSNRGYLPDVAWFRAGRLTGAVRGPGRAVPGRAGGWTGRGR